MTSERCKKVAFNRPQLASYHPVDPPSTPLTIQPQSLLAQDEQLPAQLLHGTALLVCLSCLPHQLALLPQPVLLHLHAGVSAVRDGLLQLKNLDLHGTHFLNLHCEAGPEGEGGKGKERGVSARCSVHA